MGQVGRGTCLRWSRSPIFCDSCAFLRLSSPPAVSISCMSFLDRLLGKRPDPTFNWGVFSPPIPDFDVAQMRFGSLQFGDTFEAAAFLGRPDRFEWTQGQYCQLLYASGGFQIDFDESRFAYLAFFIGPDDCLPEHKALEFSKPRVRGCIPDGVRLSVETDGTMLERIFGAPGSLEVEPDETILYYTRQGVTMEFELDGRSGQLKRWNLYPPDA